MISFDDYMENYHENDMGLDLLSEIITVTQKTRNLIYQEWDKITSFFKEFDPVKHGYEIQKSNDYTFKNEFLLDSYFKIYDQVSNQIKIFNLKPGDNMNLYYYSYEESILEFWKDNGVLYGERDKNGCINTGSCLTIQCINNFDWEIFLKIYKMTNN